MGEANLSVGELAETVLREMGFSAALFGGVFNDARHNSFAYGMRQVGTRNDERTLGAEVVPRVGQVISHHSNRGGEILNRELLKRFPQLGSERPTGIAEIVNSVTAISPGKIGIGIDVYCIELNEGMEQRRLKYTGGGVFRYEKTSVSINRSA